MISRRHSSLQLEEKKKRGGRLVRATYSYLWRRLPLSQHLIPLAYLYDCACALLSHRCVVCSFGNWEDFNRLCGCRLFTNGISVVGRPALRLLLLSSIFCVISRSYFSFGVRFRKKIIFCKCNFIENFFVFVRFDFVSV